MTSYAERSSYWRTNPGIVPVRIPSVGRIVHYVSYGTPGGEYPSTCRAAVITEVTEHPDADGTAGLCVMNPSGLFLNRNVPHAEDKAAGAEQHPPGTWHWPEMVDE